MRIVVDTNVLASAVFFGGKPGELLRLILARYVSAVATQEILDEYQDTIDYLHRGINGDCRKMQFPPLVFLQKIINGILILVQYLLRSHG